MNRDKDNSDDTATTKTTKGTLTSFAAFLYSASVSTLVSYFGYVIK